MLHCVSSIGSPANSKAPERQNIGVLNMAAMVLRAQRFLEKHGLDASRVPNTKRIPSGLQTLACNTIRGCQNIKQGFFNKASATLQVLPTRDPLLLETARYALSMRDSRAGNVCHGCILNSLKRGYIGDYRGVL